VGRCPEPQPTKAEGITSISGCSGDLICSLKPSQAGPVKVHQQAKRLTVAFSHSPAPAAYRRSKRSSGLPAGLEPANMFNRQFGG